ncbi:MAG: hypothetical protein WBB07_19575 [Mycobacterium sp.]
MLPDGHVVDLQRLFKLQRISATERTLNEVGDVGVTDHLRQSPEVRAALPALIADTVADQDVHSALISRFAGSLTTLRTRFDQPDDVPAQDSDLPCSPKLLSAAPFSASSSGTTPRWTLRG